MGITITKEQQLFVQAMLIIRSDIDKSSDEYKRAKEFLDEWFKKQDEEVK